MFYSQFILAKKGPLGTIWIAAHLERKLRKNQVADTDIGVSVDSILFPEVPIALRLSSHLLLGVVRIYSRKVNYLFDDCSEALLKIKQAFRSTAVDLPPEESTAPYHSITLPETFDLDDFELPDNEIYQGNYVDHHVSSREQITLQDSMDGVVFANQFGLDERFGDGDASQIGLDLDEELLMDKAKSQVGEEASNCSFNPQESTLTVTLLELKDGSDEEMLETTQTMVLDFVDQTEVPSANSEFVEYAQAPSTPGLLQEPNLSSVQEAFACDDHLEGEDHNVTEFVVEGGKVSEPCKLDLYDGGDNGSKWSSGVEENGHLSIGTENKQVQSELFLSTVSAVEHLPKDEIGVLDGKALKEREDTRNGDLLSNTETNIVDQMDVDCGTEDRLDGRLTSGFCAVSNDVETHSGCKSSSSSDIVQVPEGSLVDGQVSPKICDIVEDGKILDAVLPQETSLVCEVNNSEFRYDRDPNNDETSVPVIHKEMSSRGKPVLRGCDTVINQHDTLSFGECQATDHMKPGLERNELSEAALCGEGDCNNSNELISNTTSSEIPSNVKSSTAPELSAPERLLSVPNDLSRPNNPLLDFSTIDKDILHENNDGSDAIKPTSGKKRNFAESTLTVHSLNSTDSVGVARYKRTTEYIPDDDDLLSSILVGRRTSVLKMKPTPPVAETTSMKRSRSSVVRASTTKRKVLMDDSMVLHGDIIRQQLTSTEDIRRVRKKAPCTRPEISMIQRQFLEDEIFCDTILSGMSGQLMELQCETLDFSGVRVSEDCQEIASSEVAKYSEPALISNIVKESENEGNIESAIIRNDIEAPPVDISIQTENEHAGELNLEFRDFQTPVQETANVDVLKFQTSPNQLQGEITKMEIERGNVELTNLGTESTISGLGFTSPDVRNNSFDSEGPLLMDTTCFPSEMRLGIEQDIEHVIDASTGDIGQKEGPDIDNLCIKDESRGLFVDCSEPTISLKEGDVRYEDTGIDDKDPTSSCMNDEVANIGSPSTVGHYVDDKSVSTFSGVHTDCPEDDGPNVVDAAVSTVNHSIGEDHENFEDPTAGNDTEFLNVDDDEMVGDEEDEQFAEETCLAENSGWSSRTRAVAKFLQTVFDNEAIHGKKVLAMDNLLVRKSRKEASRMFFETLVLKTRDYVHVEQAKPFENISIKPRAKLMKSDF